MTIKAYKLKINRRVDFLHAAGCGWCVGWILESDTCSQNKHQSENKCRIQVSGLRLKYLFQTALAVIKAVAFMHTITPQKARRTPHRWT